MIPDIMTVIMIGGGRRDMPVPMIMTIMVVHLIKYDF
jgi:hypothetical protein